MPNFTRRQTLAGLTGLGAAGFLAGAVPLPSRAATVRGGSVKFGIAGGATSDTLDPRGSPDTHLALAWWAIRNSLTEVLPDGTLNGEIAESWSASDDAKVWTFNIRRGVTFHDGKPLTADDVVASLNFHRGENSTSAGKALVSSVANLSAPDPHTVIIELSAGNADFAFLTSDYHLLILPAKDGVVDWESGNGTGGYILEKFEPGVSIKLRRNPNYFKGDARAHFDEVELINIPEAATRQAALLSGEVDAIGRIDVKTVSRLAAVSGISVRETVGRQYSTILMDTTSSLFKNKDVRLAFKHAINREQILKTALLGHGEIGNDQPIGPTYQYFDPQLPQRSFDPELAKFLLKKAGAEGVKVQLETSEIAWPAGSVDAAVLYAEQAKASGIDIEVVRRPNDGYWSNVWSKAPFAMGYVGGRATEDWIFTAFYAANAVNNDTHWDNSRFEELLVKGRLTVDPDERRKIYSEMQHLLNDDGGLIAPIFANHIVAVGPKVSTPEHLGGNWELDNWRAVERWSLAG